MSIGVDLILGADFYVTESLYVGAEILWGWSTMTMKEEVTEIKSSGATTKVVDPEAKLSGFGIGTSGIRLGWKF